MTRHTTLIPRDVALRLTLVMSAVVGLATAATGWVFGVRPDLALLLGALGLVVAAAVIGATLLLLEWWISPGPEPVDFPRLRFEASGPPIAFDVPPGGAASGRYVVLNDVTATNESGRPISLDLRLRAYFSDDEYVVWEPAPEASPAWETGRTDLGVAATAPLRLPLELDAHGHDHAGGYVAFRLEADGDADELIRAHHDRPRYVLEAIDRESKAVRVTDVGKAA